MIFDWAFRDKSGNIVLVESKTGPHARLSRGQPAVMKWVRANGTLLLYGRAATRAGISGPVRVRARVDYWQRR